ncbi:MAG: hypothetical protein HYZ75_06640 [Elusimicrobia bacterium]|nr:hypothetical protein [Elusimicrobiota bacterium]
MRATILLLAAALAAPSWSAAEDGQPTPEYLEYQKNAEEQGPDPKLETEHYHRQLKLTPEQKKKAMTIFEDQRELFKEHYGARMKFQREVEAMHLRIKELNKGFEAEGRKLEEQRADVRKRFRQMLSAKQRKDYDMMLEQSDRQEREFRQRKEEEDVRRLGGDGIQGMGHRPKKSEKPRKR